jgi:DNA-binding transcriptional LysR family regulator
MNLAQLRALVAVADEGSFTRAASTLDVTQSAVSHAVAALERELGQRLVVRDTPTVGLTAVGRAVVDEARAAVRASEAVAQLAGTAGAPLAGELRIAGLPSLDLAVLPSLLRQFRRRHPLARIFLLEGSDEEVLEWVQRGVVDLGCVVDSAGIPGPPLADDEYVAVLDPAHPLAREHDVTVEDLSDDPFIVSGSGCEPFLQRLFDDAGVRFRPSHRVNQLTTILTMVRTGMGVTVLPSLLLEGGRHDLVALPLRPRVPRRVLLGHRTYVRPHVLAQAVLDLVAEAGPVRCAESHPRNGDVTDATRPGIAPVPSHQPIASLKTSRPSGHARGRRRFA